MVDRFVKSREFALGIRRVKVVCVAANVENGK